MKGEIREIISGLMAARMERIEKVKEVIGERDSFHIKKRHVHIYHVTAMQEIDVSSESEERSLEIALDMIEKKKWRKPDCNVLAVIPVETEKEG